MDATTRAWYEREFQRLCDGTYTPTPWHDLFPLIHEHFVHLSLKHPGLVAYTQNDDKGRRDIQTPIKPGRYLTKYYSKLLTVPQIEAYAALVTSTRHELKTASTADEIEQVYVGGPGNCMKNPPELHSILPFHPMRALAGGDLAVAYYGDIAHCAAHCDIWPERKIRSHKIYGDWRVLGRLLDEAGYTVGSFEGARIQAFRIKPRLYVMPYLDPVQGATLKKGQFVLGDGPYSTQEPRGYSSYLGRLQG